MSAISHVRGGPALTLACSACTLMHLNCLSCCVPQVLVSGGLFALAHPSSQFVPEAATGVVLGAAYLASRGNLLVPTLAHAGYNAAIILAAALFATS